MAMAPREVADEAASVADMGLERECSHLKASAPAFRTGRECIDLYFG